MAKKIWEAKPQILKKIVKFYHEGTVHHWNNWRCYSGSLQDLMWSVTVSDEGMVIGSWENTTVVMQSPKPLIALTVPIVKLFQEQLQRLNNFLEYFSNVKTPSPSTLNLSRRYTKCWAPVLESEIAVHNFNASITVRSSKTGYGNKTNKKRKLIFHQHRKDTSSILL